MSCSDREDIKQFQTKRVELGRHRLTIKSNAETSNLLFYCLIIFLITFSHNFCPFIGDLYRKYETLPFLNRKYVLDLISGGSQNGVCHVKEQKQRLFLLLSHSHPGRREGRGGPTGATSGPARRPVCQRYSRIFERGVTGATPRRRGDNGVSPAAARRRPRQPLWTDANIWGSRIVPEQQWC